MDVIVVIGSLVENVICADSLVSARDAYPEGALFLERTDGESVGPNWSYDGTTFTAPPAPPPQVIDKVSFLQRFTAAQRQAIQLRRAQGTDGVIMDAMYMLDAATLIDPANADTIGFVQYLQNVGLIGADDVARILS